MDPESELQRLEKYVEKILTRFSALKAEKLQLEKDLTARDQLIEELRDTIASKVTERNEISERVNKIVDQIEDWELYLDEEDVEGAESSGEIDNNGGEAQAGEKETVGESEEDRGRHELFSMHEDKRY